MENKKINFFKIEKSQEFLVSLLSLILFFLFVYGFYTNENSAGSGGYNGDLNHIWSNLTLLKESFLSNLNSSLYSDSRPPLSYLIHILFNPYINQIESFRVTVFLISFVVPFLLYFALKENYGHLEKKLLILIALIVTLSPYFRTTAYWGLGENYGFIFLLASFLQLKKLKKSISFNTNLQNYSQILFLCLFSSLCIYFDQKLIFVPIIILVEILRQNLNIKYKLSSLIYFFIFAIPYLYLISIWGSVIPSDASSKRFVAEKISLFNVGYCLTIISFYIVPLIFMKEFNFLQFKEKILNKRFAYLFGISFLYFLSIFLFNDFGNLPDVGKGYVHKLLLILNLNEFISSFLTILSFLMSVIILYLYFDKIDDFFLIIYFLVLSLFVWPFYQEYLDPLIFLLVFSFFKTKIFLNYKRVYFLILYYSTFLFTSNLYYQSIL